MMPTSRKQAILDAALQAFTEKGTAAATVDDVKRLSGASVGSIYHHFGDKEGMAVALYADVLGGYQEGFLAVLERESDAERGVRALVRHHLRWVAANPDGARFLLAGAPPGAEELLDPLNRELFGATSAWFRKQAEADAIRVLPRDLLYTVLVGPAQEFSRHWLAGRVKTSMRTAERVLAEAAWDALRPPERDS
jgi:AcrR family transcriptional regulator